MFTYQHNNPPAPFNPAYIPYAADVSRITTANLHKAGVYDIVYQEERAIMWRKEYDRLMALGKPSKGDIARAKDYLYNL